MHLKANKKYDGYDTIPILLSDLKVFGTSVKKHVKERGYWKRQDEVLKSIASVGLENPIICFIDAEGDLTTNASTRLRYCIDNEYTSIDAIFLKKKFNENGFIDELHGLRNEQERTNLYLIPHKYVYHHILKQK